LISVEDWDYIENFVVRKLWNRSKLASDVLGHIWNIVDRGEKGKLTREEFVVGMWLIDQCLAGRKLPINTVRLEVWLSAQRLTTFLRH